MKDCMKWPEAIVWLGICTAWVGVVWAFAWAHKERK
jgi:hypothetical protein